MPHLTIDYTANLQASADMGGLCTALAATMAALRHDAGGPLFPLAGTRVLARPAPHFAVADGRPDRAFIYLHLLVTPGRSAAMIERAGQALLECCKAHLAPVFAARAVGLTLQVEEGAPLYEGKHNNLAAHLAAEAAPA